jgi:hypothetical protein
MGTPKGHGWLVYVLSAALVYRNGRPYRYPEGGRVTSQYLAGAKTAPSSTPWKAASRTDKVSIDSWHGTNSTTWSKHWTNWLSKLGASPTAIRRRGRSPVPPTDSFASSLEETVSIARQPIWQEFYLKLALTSLWTRNRRKVPTCVRHRSTWPLVTSVLHRSSV